MIFLLTFLLLLSFIELGIGDNLRSVNLTVWTMNRRGILSSVAFLSFWAITQVYAQTFVNPRQPVKPFQDSGRDVSQSSWNWQTPSSTAIDDASRSNASAHFDSAKLAATLDNEKPAQAEKTKAIEEVETTTTVAVTEQPAVTAVTAPKGGSKKILLIGGACMALLVFWMFRRPTNIPKKPRYL